MATHVGAEATTVFMRTKLRTNTQTQTQQQLAEMGKQCTAAGVQRGIAVVLEEHFLFSFNPYPANMENRVSS